MRRRLRIAWTVFFAVLTVALCVLWAENSLMLRKLFVRVPFYYLEASSARGRFGFQVHGEHFEPGELATRWDAISIPLDSKYEVFSDTKDAKLGFSFLHFVLRRTQNNVLHNWRFTVPCWFLVGVSFSLATVLWLPFRFSLRTMLIATTLVAVLLGLIVWAARG